MRGETDLIQSKDRLRIFLTHVTQINFEENVYTGNDDENYDIEFVMNDGRTIINTMSAKDIMDIGHYVSSHKDLSKKIIIDF